MSSAPGVVAVVQRAVERDVNNHAEHEDRETAFGAGETFSERLAAQIGLRPVSDRQRMLAAFLIGNLDEAGYLRRDLYAISSDLAFGQGVEVGEEELEKVLSIVQQLDPAGVGARDLRECLLIQIDRKLDAKTGEAQPALSLAHRILEEQFEAFTKKHFDKLVARLEVDEDALRAAMEEITRLNPKPGNSGSDNARPIQAVVPDFHVSVEGDELRLQINGRNAPELRVSNEYRDIMEGYSAAKNPDRSQKEAITFVKRKVDAAKWFIDAIRQRQQTMFNTMYAIMNYQYDYFLTGDQKRLRPMILKDIADITGLDISTVSRVANSKYVQTEFGTKRLKDFFSESLQTADGEEVSTLEVKKILTEIINGENKRKPYSDEKLKNLLQEKGYNIARRTVAKYREQLNIPVARLRKEL